MNNEGKLKILILVLFLVIGWLAVNTVYQSFDNRASHIEIKQLEQVQDSLQESFIELNDSIVTHKITIAYLRQKLQQDTTLLNIIQFKKHETIISIDTMSTDELYRFFSDH